MPKFTVFTSSMARQERRHWLLAGGALALAGALLVPLGSPWQQIVHADPTTQDGPTTQEHRTAENTAATLQALIESGDVDSLEQLRALLVSLEDSGDQQVAESPQDALQRRQEIERITSIIIAGTVDAEAPAAVSSTPALVLPTLRANSRVSSLGKLRRSTAPIKRAHKAESLTVYDNFGWIGASGVDGTGPSLNDSGKLLEIVETATSNRFEVDFNRIQPGVLITNLPVTLDEPGLYYLLGSLTNSSPGDNGITIDSDDVTLDMRGSTLFGTAISGVASGDGIHVLGSHTNIKVRDGGIVGWNGDGVNASQTSFAIYSDVHVRSNGGNGVNSFLNTLISRVSAYSNSLAGISADSGSVVFHSTTGQNGDDGVQLGSGCSTINSAAFDNGGDGFSVGNGGLIVASSATDNVSVGFNIGDYSQVTESTAYDNMSHGFELGEGSLISHCIASLNNGNGIEVGNSSLVRANKVHENDLDGISVTGTGTHLIDNQSTDNDQVGIEITGTGNLLTGTTAGGNITNYNVDAANAFGPILDVTNFGDLSGFAGADHPWANFSF